MALIITERLSMRWLTRDDAELMLAVWNDPAFLEHVGDREIRTLEQAQGALEEGAFRLYAERGYGPFRVALRSDDTAIGTCGLFLREGFEEPDLGYSILPEFCGRGYAYEAAKAVLEYARTELALPKITAFISPGNNPSIGLATKLGLRFERMARVSGDDIDVGLYGMALN